jgi:HSP20 family protein
MYTLSFPNRRASLFDLIERPFDFLTSYESKADYEKYSTGSTDSHHIIQVALPGHNKETIKVSVDNNKLSISAEAQTDLKTPLCKSESYRFVLPKNCNPEEIDAKIIDGILTVSVSKIIEKKSSKKIDVEVN